MAGRADFSAATKKMLAERAGYQCSVPRCGRRTVGPGTSPQGVVRTGMAAHIHAAAEGGPRGTGGLSDEQRRSASNGLWCCYSHGKAIDDDSEGAYSVPQLQAWKRLHEARMGAEVSGGFPFDSFGLVDTITVHSAPGSLSGRTFDFGVCNVIYGDNGSGKTVLARLIASVADPDHVAELSTTTDVDIAVRWFDPLSREVNTSGRAGEVRHVLDGRQVPYVVRPFKTIHIEEDRPRTVTVSGLAAYFQLSTAAAKAILRELPACGGAVKGVDLDGDLIKMAVEWSGHVWTDPSRLPGVLETVLFAEFAAALARRHAENEPTFLIADRLFTNHGTGRQVELYDRLQHMIGDAQLGVVSERYELASALRRSWSILALDVGGRRTGGPVPIEFEVASAPRDGRSARFAPR